jgi:hypothetical protein
MTPIQGYAATLKRKGRARPDFLRFGGGLTKQWDDADVFASATDAVDAARAQAHSLYDLPGFVAIGTDGRQHEEPTP